eukprot:Phypoly_transcript_04096.p1 GENE.Phypoly_transcript_04096~~Phypoly_transcript_04096.p1  ORF type:complete len:194 (-),score=38.13 Phypoly_transcript_04096:1293-1874(-)
MATATPSKQISESCFDFLAMEMVDYVVRSTPADNASEGVFYKLERLGFRVGQRLAERYTMDHQRFQDTLEVIKFICKEFWQMLYKKQVDNLRTNHRGVFVLQDNRFRPLLHVSPDAPATSSTPSTTPNPSTSSAGSTNPGQPSALGGKEVASLYVTFPCGLIRGALQALAVPAVVTVDVSAIPSAQFTIKVKS